MDFLTAQDILGHKIGQDGVLYFLVQLKCTWISINELKKIKNGNNLLSVFQKDHNLQIEYINEGSLKKTGFNISTLMEKTNDSRPKSESIKGKQDLHVNNSKNEDKDAIFKKMSNFVDALSKSSTVKSNQTTVSTCQSIVSACHRTVSTCQSTVSTCHRTVSTCQPTSISPTRSHQQGNKTLLSFPKHNVSPNVKPSIQSTTALHQKMSTSLQNAKDLPCTKPQSHIITSTLTKSNKEVVKPTSEMREKLSFKTTSITNSTSKPSFKTTNIASSTSKPSFKTINIASSVLSSNSKTSISGQLQNNVLTAQKQISSPITNPYQPVSNQVVNNANSRNLSLQKTPPLRYKDVPPLTKLDSNRNKNFSEQDNRKQNIQPSYNTHQHSNSAFHNPKTNTQPQQHQSSKPNQNPNLISPRKTIQSKLFPTQCLKRDIYGSEKTLQQTNFDPYLNYPIPAAMFNPQILSYQMINNQMRNVFPHNNSPLKYNENSKTSLRTSSPQKIIFPPSIPNIPPLLSAAIGTTISPHLNQLPRFSEHSWNKLPATKQVEILNNIKENSGPLRFIMKNKTPENLVEPSIPTAISFPLGFLQDQSVPTTTTISHIHRSSKSNSVIDSVLHNNQPNKMTSTPTMISHSTSAMILHSMSMISHSTHAMIPQYTSTMISHSMPAMISHFHQPSKSVSTVPSLTQPTNTSSVKASITGLYQQTVTASNPKSVKEKSAIPFNAISTTVGMTPFCVTTKLNLTNSSGKKDLEKKALKTHSSSEKPSNLNAKVDSSINTAKTASSSSLYQSSKTASSCIQSETSGKEKYQSVIPSIIISTTTSMTPLFVSTNVNSTNIAGKKDDSEQKALETHSTSKNGAYLNTTITSSISTVKTTIATIAEGPLSPSRMVVGSLWSCLPCKKNFPHKRSYMFHEKNCPNKKHAMIKTCDEEQPASNNVHIESNEKSQCKDISKKEENLLNDEKIDTFSADIDFSELPENDISSCYVDFSLDTFTSAVEESLEILNSLNSKNKTNGTAMSVKCDEEKNLIEKTNVNNISKINNGDKNIKKTFSKNTDNKISDLKNESKVKKNKTDTSLLNKESVKKPKLLVQKNLTNHSKTEGVSKYKDNIDLENKSQKSLQECKLNSAFTTETTEMSNQTPNTHKISNTSNINIKNDSTGMMIKYDNEKNFGEKTDGDNLSKIHDVGEKINNTFSQNDHTEISDLKDDSPVKKKRNDNSLLNNETAKEQKFSVQRNLKDHSKMKEETKYNDNIHLKNKSQKSLRKRKLNPACVTEATVMSNQIDEQLINVQAKSKEEERSFRSKKTHKTSVGMRSKLTESEPLRLKIFKINKQNLKEYNDLDNHTAANSIASDSDSESLADNSIASDSDAESVAYAFPEGTEYCDLSVKPFNTSTSSSKSKFINSHEKIDDIICSKNTHVDSVSPDTESLATEYCDLSVQQFDASISFSKLNSNHSYEKIEDIIRPQKTHADTPSVSDKVATSTKENSVDSYIVDDALFSSNSPKQTSSDHFTAVATGNLSTSLEETTNMKKHKQKKGKHQKNKNKNHYNFDCNISPKSVGSPETKFKTSKCVKNPYEVTVNGITFDRRFYTPPTTRLAKQLSHEFDEDNADDSSNEETVIVVDQLSVPALLTMKELKELATLKKVMF